VASAIDTVSGLDMIRALIDGERRGAVLADLARGRMRAKIADLSLALEGRTAAPVAIPQVNGHLVQIRHAVVLIHRPPRKIMSSALKTAYVADNGVNWLEQQKISSRIRSFDRALLRWPIAAGWRLVTAPGTALPRPSLASGSARGDLSRGPLVPAVRPVLPRC